MIYEGIGQSIEAPEHYDVVHKVPGNGLLELEAPQKENAYALPSGGHHADEAHVANDPQPRQTSHAKLCEGYKHFTPCRLAVAVVVRGELDHAGVQSSNHAVECVTHIHSVAHFRKHFEAFQRFFQNALIGRSLEDLRDAGNEPVRHHGKNVFEKLRGTRGTIKALVAVGLKQRH